MKVFKNIIEFFKNPLSKIKSGKSPEKSATLDVDTLKQIVKEVMSTREDEITCGECFSELDKFAESVLAGKNVSAAMPLVKHHLEHCHDCREEFEMLLEALKSL